VYIYIYIYMYIYIYIYMYCKYEFCSAHQCDKKHISMKYITRVNESCRTVGMVKENSKQDCYVFCMELLLAVIGSHVTHKNESCHIFE